VNGNRSAIEIEGEIPGKAPPRIPQATPANAAGTMGVVKGLGSDSKFKVQRFTVQGSVHGSGSRFTVPVHGSRFGEIVHLPVCASSPEPNDERDHELREPNMSPEP
jgi:hypothetical protein